MEIKCNSCGCAYAEYWRRVIARLIDVLLFCLSYGIIAAIANDKSKENGLKFIFSVMYLLYVVLMDSSVNQGTLGKMLVGIKVVDMEGNRISIGRATGRYFGNLLILFTLFIGYIVAGFSKRGQALHDMVSGCLVVKKKATPNEVRCCNVTPSLTVSSVIFMIITLIPPIGIIAAIIIPQIAANKSINSIGNNLHKNSISKESVRYANLKKINPSLPDLNLENIRKQTWYYLDPEYSYAIIGDVNDYKIIIHKYEPRPDDEKPYINCNIYLLNCKNKLDYLSEWFLQYDSDNDKFYEQFPYVNTSTVENTYDSNNVTTKQVCEANSPPLPLPR